MVGGHSSNEIADEQAKGGEDDQKTSAEFLIFF